MTDLRPEEEWARVMISTALGVPVEQHDDGSRPSMYDLVIQYPDRPSGAVEVTVAAASDSVELWKLMNGKRERWLVDELKGGWLITVLPSARYKSLRASLPALLRTLERSGIRHLDPSLDHCVSSAKLAQSLAIVDMWQSDDTSFPGSVYLTIEEPHERTGAWVAAASNALPPWVGEFLRSPERADVLRKLANSGAVERHAFLFQAGFTTAPFRVTDLLIRDDAPIPSEAPDLPPEVTHVWVASTWTNSCGLRWGAATGWLRFDKATQAASN